MKALPALLISVLAAVFEKKGGQLPVFPKTIRA
jgi:hypothetical protein